MIAVAESNFSFVSWSYLFSLFLFPSNLFPQISIKLDNRSNKRRIHERGPFFFHVPRIYQFNILYPFNFLGWMPFIFGYRPFIKSSFSKPSLFCAMNRLRGTGEGRPSSFTFVRRPSSARGRFVPLPSVLVNQ